MKKIIFYFSAIVAFVTAGDFKSTTDNGDNKVVDLLLESHFVQESLITAQDMLNEQLFEESVSQRQSRPTRCQIAHAGFHSRPTTEVLQRGKVAKLLVLATIQAVEKLGSDHPQAQKQKRQVSNLFRGSQQRQTSSESFLSGNRFLPRFVQSIIQINSQVNKIVNAHKNILWVP